MATQEWREKNKEKLRAYRREWYRKNATHAKGKVVERRKGILAFIESQKAGRSCERCDETFVRCLDFYHRDPAEKLIALSQLARYKGWKRSRIVEEIGKCILLCANCHRKQTFAYQRVHVGDARGAGRSPKPASRGSSPLSPAKV